MGLWILVIAIAVLLVGFVAALSYVFHALLTALEGTDQRHAARRTVGRPKKGR